MKTTFFDSGFDNILLFNFKLFINWFGVDRKKKFKNLLDIMIYNPILNLLSIFSICGCFVFLLPIKTQLIRSPPFAITQPHSRWLSLTIQLSTIIVSVI